jgi:hypothetical protein
MAGRSAACDSGKALEKVVQNVAEKLGLDVKRQVKVGRRIWGAERRIDLIVSDNSKRRLGIECKFQGTSGTAEEKIPAIINDITAWPIDGLVVFDGQGFSNHMKTFLLSSGKAIFLEDLDVWLRLYFGLEI